MVGQVWPSIALLGALLWFAPAFAALHVDTIAPDNTPKGIDEQNDSEQDAQEPTSSAAAVDEKSGNSTTSPQEGEEESKFLRLMERLRPQVRIPVRLNTTVQGTERNRFNGYRFDTILTLPRLSGTITDYIGWQLSFFGQVANFTQAELRVLDVIAELNILPELSFWAGRFTVPGARSYLSGPFFVPVWNFPGFYGNGEIIGTIGGPVGRDVGGLIWGDVGEGRFKYYAAIQALEDRTISPRMTTRLNVTLYGKEPGFYNAGSYLGKRDVVALGGSVQYQPDGEQIVEDPEMEPVVQGDLWVADIDLIAEKNFGPGGTPTFEATYYVFDRFQPYQHAYFVSLSYLLPWQVGRGGVQYAARWQQTFTGFRPTRGLRGLDVSVAYLFAGYRARAALVYQRQWFNDGGPVWNAINIGFQFIVI